MGYTRWMKASFQFLGTSASAGVPIIGCKCGICTSLDPRDQRLRSAGLIRIAGKSLLIDVGPDFRSQALKYGIDQVDGLLLTHTHYDHIAGIDDLRIFNVRSKRPMPCLLSQESLSDIERRYFYFFETDKKKPDATARFDFQVLPEELTGKVEFLGFPIAYGTYYQGGMRVNGFRLGDFAYVSDIRDFDDSIFEMLEGVKILALSALRIEPSEVHLNFEEAVAFAEKCKAEQTWITHLSHFVDHDKGNELFPPNIKMAYDGLQLDFICTI